MKIAFTDNYCDTVKKVGDMHTIIVVYCGFGEFGVKIADMITHVKFYVNRFRDFVVLAPKYCHSP